MADGDAKVCSKMSASVDWILHRPSYRYFLLFTIFLFFLNIVLITHVVDLQILVQRLVYEAESSSGTVPEKQLAPAVTVDQLKFECNVTEDLAIDAIGRMKTEECRDTARELVCNLDARIPLSLPNSCPRFDEKMQNAFIGCYADSKTARILDGHLYKFATNNSREYCAAACLRAGYKYAGVEYTTECYCGDTFVNPVNVSLALCERYRCPNDNSSFCGGFEAIAIYSTGLQEKTLHVIDYMESSDQASSDVQIMFLLQVNGRNLRQILRLLRIIYSRKHRYIIHVDSRQQYLFKELVQLEERLLELGIRNLHVMKRRHATIWGASNLLTMLLDSVRDAFQLLKWTEWDFLINLSESDFPLLSMSELEFHLARNKGMNFLSSHGYDTGKFIQKQGFDFIFLQCEERMWRLGKRQSFPRGLRVDGGSDWIVLDRSLLNYSISDDVLPKNLREIFSNILLPVESFFHTLAANSPYCNRTVKGNLRITNWKRKQGCRCAMLKKVVDWCGCSPLVFTMEDASKFSDKAAQKRPGFFGRKFEGLVSQSAMALAEARALKDHTELIPPNDMSLQKTWVNFYSSSTEHSNLLVEWSRAIFSSMSQSIAELVSCNFADLLSLFAYKENDTAAVKTVAEFRVLCNGAEERRIQYLISPRDHSVVSPGALFGDFRLIGLSAGSDCDLKEDIFRNYAGVFSEKDDLLVQFRWAPKEKNLSTLSLNFTSPTISVEWQSPKEHVFQTKVSRYDSIHGAQYGVIPLNMRSPGEWIALLKATNDRNATEELASIRFVVFDFDAQTISVPLVSNYFTVSAICSETFVKNLPACNATSWSHSSPDPKSQFF